MEDQLNRVRISIWQKLHQQFQPFSTNQSPNNELKVDRVKLQQIIKTVFSSIDQNASDSLVQNMFRLDRKNTGFVSFHQFGNFIVKKYCGEMCLQLMHKNKQIQNAAEKKISLNEFTKLYGKLLEFGSTKGEKFNNLEQMSIDQKYCAKVIFDGIDNDNDQLITYVQYFQMIDRYISMNSDDVSKTFSNSSQLQYSFVSSETEKKHYQQKIMMSKLQDKIKQVHNLEQSPQPDHKPISQTYPHKNIFEQKMISPKIENSVEIYNLPEIRGVQFVSSIKQSNLENIRKIIRNEESDSIIESRQQESQKQVQKLLITQKLRVNETDNLNKGSHTEISQISLIETLVGMNKQRPQPSIKSIKLDDRSMSETNNNYHDPLQYYLKFDIFEKVQKSSIPQKEWKIILGIWMELIDQYERCLPGKKQARESSQKSIASSGEIGIDVKKAENILRIILPVQLVTNTQRNQEILNLLFPFGARDLSYQVDFLSFSRFILMYLGEKSLKKYQKGQVSGNTSIKNQQQFTQILYQAYGRLINNFYDQKTEIYQIYNRLTRKEFESKWHNTMKSPQNLSYKEYFRWINHHIVQLNI